MGRSLAKTLILASLALLGACLEIAPTSSVPFQPSIERQTRYAAEIALAVKEDRRDEISEAAANGRMVLPQLPEIWVPPVADPDARQAARALDLARLEPGAGSGSAGRGCASQATELLAAIPPADCRPSWRGQALVLPPFDERSMPPGTAPLILEPSEEASGPEPRPPG